MGTLRAIHWTAAKKKVKTKDWEAKLKFKDDFGPMLDKFQDRSYKIDELNDAVNALLYEQIKAAQQIAVTAKSYRLKIEAATKNEVISEQDQAHLFKALAAIDEIARDLIGRNNAALKYNVTYTKYVADQFK